MSIKLDFEKQYFAVKLFIQIFVYLWLE